MFFRSDNTSGAAPEIMAAIAAANEGAVASYGADEASARVEALVRELFEAPHARVHLVATGTAANAISLATLCSPWGAIFCHRIAHIEVDECNAPEFYSGAKLSVLDGAHAKIGVETFAEAVARSGRGSVHAAQPAVLSLTQATERGAAYGVDEIARLSAIAHEAAMRVHMDGTRFATALARTNATPAEMSWKAGVDILCLGATKTGALGAEAVVVFDPELSWEIELRRKRAGHLFSKMRFVAAQMEAWLADGLWLRLARHANAMADRLAAGVAAAGAEVLNPVEANLMFVRLSAAQHRRLTAAGAQYAPWPAWQASERGPEDPIEVRLVCSFATTEAEVDRFVALLEEPAADALPHLP